MNDEQIRQLRAAIAKARQAYSLHPEAYDQELVMLLRNWFLSSATTMENMLDEQERFNGRTGCSPPSKTGDRE
jgi:hypothetical protein